MMAKTKPDPGSCIDVRYSKLYAGTMLLLAVAPLIVAVNKITSLKQDVFQDTNFIVPAIAILLVIFVVYVSITLPKRRCIRLDKGNKVLMIFDVIGSWSRKYPYDSIYITGEKFHIEKDGVKKKVGFLKYTCNNDDLRSLVKTIGG